MLADSKYQAAMKLVGSWNHWQRLTQSKRFMQGPEKGFQWTGLQRWREEKEEKDRAKAYNQLKILAEEGNVQAIRLIFQGQDQKKRGRPSKAEVQKAAEEQAALTRSIKQDLKLVATNVKHTSDN